MILVVGGAGYIGSHAARTLRRHGYEVVIYDNLSRGHDFLVEGFELVVADIADHKRLTQVMKGVDAVMHFAAFPRSVNPSRTHGSISKTTPKVDSRC